jgi:hypothetical protein
MTDKIELVIGALQQRIGELVSQYETNIAILRADLTQLADEFENLKSQEEPKKKTKE